MSLSQYAKKRDRFELRIDGKRIPWRHFPCERCEHTAGLEKNKPPCNECDHNPNAASDSEERMTCEGCARIDSQGCCMITRIKELGCNSWTPKGGAG